MRIFKKISYLSLALMMVGAISFTGCEEKEYFVPQEGKNDTPSSLDFSTTSKVELKLNYDLPKGFISTFDVYTENPLTAEGVLRTDITPITGGINVAGVSKIMRMLPAYAKDLYLYTSDLFVPSLMYAKVSGGIASFEQVNISTRSASPATRTIGNKAINHYLTSSSDYYTTTNGNEYKYDLINPVKTKAFDATTLTTISQTFPEQKKVTNTDFFEDVIVTVTDKDIQEGVFISLAHSGAGYDNSLSYFVYTGNKRLAELTSSERENLELINIFQLADLYNNSYKHKGYGLTAGKCVQLKYKNDAGKYINEFPKGAQIGFVLHSSGFDSSNFSVKTDVTNLYSIAAWNNQNNNNGHYTVSCTVNKEKFFGFEDQAVGDFDCNDVMFHIIADGFNPTPTPDIREVEKSATHRGLLAFEDLWPKMGDYDMNDFVATYESTVTYIVQQQREVGASDWTDIADIRVKGVKDVITVIHNGADYSNAFSYKVDFDYDLVKSIKTPAGATVTEDGSGFIVDLCECNPLPKMVVGATPAEYTVEMEFYDGKDGTTIMPVEGFYEVVAPYNPFISPAETPGAEIHLSNYPPTSRASDIYFGTEDDRSNKVDKWYVGSTNDKYPFALHLAGVTVFRCIPTECVAISKTYSQYSSWVEGGCNNEGENSGWYLNP